MPNTSIMVLLVLSVLFSVFQNIAVLLKIGIVVGIDNTSLNIVDDIILPISNYQQAIYFCVAQE